MSDAQVKATPSKAAMELAENVADLLAMPYQDAKELGLAEHIQSALRDLLEKAEAFRAKNYNNIGARDLAAALEPWKPK